MIIIEERQLAQLILPSDWLFGNAIVSTITNALWSTLQTALYVERRNWKGGHSGAPAEAALD